MLKNTFTIICLVLLTVFSFSSFIEKEEIKLKQITYEVIVNVTPEKAWEVLKSYGNVGSYHSSIQSSKSIGHSKNEASMGCERQCTIDNGKKDIVVKERIVEIKEGQYYKYDVYEWSNFPLKKLYNTFGVKKNEEGKTVIYQTTDYRLKPGFLTGLMGGKLKKGNRDALIAYKHYMETDEKNVNMDELKKKYKDL